LDRGRHWFIDPLYKIKVQVVSQREVGLLRQDLDIIIKSGSRKRHAPVLDLKNRPGSGRQSAG
jgi:hypothetical protein